MRKCVLVVCFCFISGLVFAQDAAEISFDYTKRSGMASNQFAVWVEDASGSYVTTLYVTKFTAKKGFKNRADALRTWVASANPANKGKDAFDAVTHATPKSSTVTCSWDYTDAQGNPVPEGTYVILVEGTIYWKDAVVCKAEIDTGKKSGDIKAPVEITYSTPEAKQSDMIRNVTITY